MYDLGRMNRPYSALFVSLASALLLAACGTGRGVEIPPTEAPISRDCPFEEDSRPDTSREGRAFEAVFGFVGSVWTREAAREYGAAPGELRMREREARSHLTPEYSSRLPRLEDARSPIHSGEGSRSFTADHLRTRFGRGTATQEIAYCFAGGGVWTQVFHLGRADGGWRIDSIEPARRRCAS